MHSNMKRIFATIAAVAAMAACQKSVETGDVLFFTGTEASAEVSMYVDGPASSSFTVTSTAKATKDILVVLSVDPEGVDVYNSQNGTNYKLLPGSSYRLSDHRVTIKEGSYVSTPATIDIISMDDFEEGVIYCVPLKIEYADGAEALKDGEYMFVVLKAVINTTGVDFNRRGYCTVPSMMNKTSLSDLGVCTMEARIKPESWQTSNPYISTVVGVEENFLLRIGDISAPISAANTQQMQLAGRGVSITSKTYFALNQWYHVAVVDDGSVATLYVNGEVDTQVSSAGKSAINLAWDYSGGFHIGYSAGGRQFDGVISEVRVWKRALSGVELLNNQCIIADPVKAAAEDGLIAYWKLDGTSNGYKDLTGNGYDAVLNSTVNVASGIKCPIID